MVFGRWTLMLFCSTALLAWSPALGQESRKIEVVEVVAVHGLIDSSVERTVLSVIEGAERDEASMVVLQIDSAGVVGTGRAYRMIRAMRSADVPVVTWVGPSGARAANGAVAIALSGIGRGGAPGALLGPVKSLDFRRPLNLDRVPDFLGLSADDVPTDEPLTMARAHEEHKVSVLASSLEEFLDEIPRPQLDNFDTPTTFDTSDARIRFHNLDLFGRVLHAAAQPSIAYLLLLLGLVGVVFELFHPSTGPAGVAGLAGLALAVYGVVTLGGSWLGFALIVAGVVGFALDLRFQSLGPATAVGFGALVAGSLLLFNGPWLRASPWVLGFGIAGMVAFLLGAMTRVLRDLRAVARGELEVRDAHPHPNGDHA